MLFPLSKSCNGSPSYLGSKPKSLSWSFRPYSNCCGHLSPLFPQTTPLQQPCSPPVLLQTQFTPAFGPWHFLFLLSGIFFTQMACSLTSFRSSLINSSNISTPHYSLFAYPASFLLRLLLPNTYFLCLSH